MFEQTVIDREVFGTGENLLLCGSVMQPPEALLSLCGKVQCVYVDPPFGTGDTFERTRPYGEKGWKKGSPRLKLKGYEDRLEEADRLDLLEHIVTLGRELLEDTGLFYLHLDWRMTAQARLLCDRVFGPERFLNEIIWSYESGGRSLKFFPRKHDTILLYAKTKQYKFDLKRAAVPRGEKRKNHMSRGVDETGRAYSYIRTGGKEYRYYDDEPVCPGDVFSDISHLQQRDPERTGYPTQKPLKLLERLLLPVVVDGDRVVDLCCGSGTTLEAAQRLNCRFAGLDSDPAAMAVSLARLRPENLTVDCQSSASPARLLTEEGGEKAGTTHLFRLTGLETQDPDAPPEAAPLDPVESWETGEIRNGTFYAQKRWQRSFRYPALQAETRTETPVSAVMVTDAAGVRRAFERKSPLVFSPAG